MPPGTLYLVATPIGNLEDITLRALRILGEVSFIACEDTRQTRKLLDRHGIRTPTVSFHRFNEKRALHSLIQKLLSGKDLALVTDGGTPSISDPGFSLVRAASAEGFRTVPIPGASAPLAALVGSGLPAVRFSFFGFLPHRSGERQRLMESLRDRQETLIFFDSPRRVASSLEEMARIFGDRPGAICREMTKVHEEFRRGRLAELAEGLKGKTLLGEVTLVVGGAPEAPGQPAGREVLLAELEKEILETGLTRRDAVRALALRRGLRRREVYRILKDSTREAFKSGADESE